MSLIWNSKNTPSELHSILTTLGEEYPVMAMDVREYKDLYPAVDVEQALRSMRGWLLANPRKRKTARGIRRFISSWLDREQNRGGNMRAPVRSARSDLEAWANG